MKTVCMQSHYIFYAVAVISVVNNNWEQNHRALSPRKSWRSLYAQSLVHVETAVDGNYVSKKPEDTLVSGTLTMGTVMQPLILSLEHLFLEKLNNPKSGEQARNWYSWNVCGVYFGTGAIPARWGFFLTILTIVFSFFQIEQNAFGYEVCFRLLCISLTLLWPFFSPSPLSNRWCRVTARYLVEERIFSAVLDLLFLSAPRGRGGEVTPLIGLVWPLSCSHAPLHCSAPVMGLYSLSALCCMTFDGLLHQKSSAFAL